jgi:methyl-accepting chemotaxis protein
MLEESSQSVQSANQNVHLLEKLAGDLRQSVSQFKA